MFLYRDGSVFVFCTDIVLRVFGSEVILFVCRCLFVFKGCCEYFVLMFFSVAAFCTGLSRVAGKRCPGVNCL